MEPEVSHEVATEEREVVGPTISHTPAQETEPSSEPASQAQLCAE